MARRYCCTSGRGACSGKPMAAQPLPPLAAVQPVNSSAIAAISEVCMTHRTRFPTWRVFSDSSNLLTYCMCLLRCTHCTLRVAGQRQHIAGACNAPPAETHPRRARQPRVAPDQVRQHDLRACVA